MALLWLLLLSVFCVPSYQNRCPGSPPITLPITDVVLKSGHSMRGILVTAGNPPQNLSMIPHMYASVGDLCVVGPH